MPVPNPSTAGYKWKLKLRIAVADESSPKLETFTRFLYGATKKLALEQVEGLLREFKKYGYTIIEVRKEFARI